MNIVFEMVLHMYR